MENLSKIGIDFWGILVYLINYGILFAVLGIFFYPKILNTLKERRTTIEKNLKDAARLQSEMERQMETHRNEKEQMLVAMQTESATLKRELQEKRNELLKDMEAERQKMLSETKAQIEKEKRELIASAEARVLEIMKKVLLHVVAHRVPEEVVTTSVTDAWKQYKE